MNIEGISSVVTGGASGLGLATVKALAAKGAKVVIADLPQSAGAERAKELGAAVQFVPADVTDPAAMEKVFDAADALGPLRAVVHCAGKGGTVRVVERDGAPGNIELYEQIVRLNLIGSFNVLRLGASRMAKLELVDGERGICVLTASVAAWEGQVGQLPYASSKAGVVGLTMVAARDLANRQIRVCSIAPGVFDTPILSRLTEEQRKGLEKGVPNPSRLGIPHEYAMLACQIIENGYLNGTTIRLDGALRMPPR